LECCNHNFVGRPLRHLPTYPGTAESARKSRAYAWASNPLRPIDSASRSLTTIRFRNRFRWAAAYGLLRSVRPYVARLRRPAPFSIISGRNSTVLCSKEAIWASILGAFRFEALDPIHEGGLGEIDRTGLLSLMHTQRPPIEVSLAAEQAVELPGCPPKRRLLGFYCVFQDCA
jgi:hypothetical protein